MRDRYQLNQRNKMFIILKIFTSSQFCLIFALQLANSKLSPTTTVLTQDKMTFMMTKLADLHKWYISGKTNDPKHNCKFKHINPCDIVRHYPSFTHERCFWSHWTSLVGVRINLSFFIWCAAFYLYSNISKRIVLKYIFCFS